MISRKYSSLLTTVQELLLLGLDITGNHFLVITLKEVLRCCTVAPEGRAGLQAPCWLSDRSWLMEAIDRSALIEEKADFKETLLRLKSQVVTPVRKSIAPRAQLHQAHVELQKAFKTLETAQESFARTETKVKEHAQLLVEAIRKLPEHEAAVQRAQEQVRQAKAAAQQVSMVVTESEDPISDEITALERRILELRGQRDAAQQRDQNMASQSTTDDMDEPDYPDEWPAPPTPEMVPQDAEMSPQAQVMEAIGHIDERTKTASALQNVFDSMPEFLPTMRAETNPPPKARSAPYPTSG